MSKEEIRKWNEWQIVVGAEEIHSIQKKGDGDQLLVTLDTGPRPTSLMLTNTMTNLVKSKT